MLLTMEKILFLKSVPIFSGMTGEELMVLAEIVEEIEIKEGETVFRENDPGEDLFVIVRGKVNIIRSEGTPSEAIIAMLEERECFGEMSILDDEPRSATVRTAADTLLLKIQQDEFRELIREEPDVAFKVFRVFTRRLRNAQPEPELQQAPIQGSV